MTNEQREAIEELKSLSPNERAIDTVLSMIKGKEKEIEMLKEDNKRLDKEAQKYFETSIIHSKQYNQQLEKKEKTIELMAQFIATLDIEEDICANVENNNCDKMALGECENCIKQYFANKVNSKIQ